MNDILSVSRKTDIPAFYWDWFKKGIIEGNIIRFNPYYPGNKYNTIITPDKIHSIVLWSKNYDNFIKDHKFLNDYNLYFQFTITVIQKHLNLMYLVGIKLLIN